ncbi:MAG: protein kinase [Acidobacteria bacterium]|nr:protein kinase [Acidobacteriota bacterium]
MSQTNLMDPADWKIIKEAFSTAAELTSAARLAFLGTLEESVRFEVEKMLAADAADVGLLNEPLADVHALDESLPDKIDEFTILRELGRGGMGVVYEARRENEAFSQRVALKVIKRGMNNEIILKRFRSEQQILATLEHENIARFLDGGKTADGLPYYAMEFVDGVPIIEFCGRGRSTAEIIEIFRKVCAAVSYAHSQLVVHRDLKPSNIVVTADGRPKLLDFGIAKVLDTGISDGTATQLGMMTPQYASPEQIRGEKVSTLSDVYSLGVIFYEILAGGRPYDTDGKSYAEILETITNTIPLAPSGNLRAPDRIKRSLNSDLDNIVLKALQKQPTRRYQSVEQFAEDLRRWLLGLPVTARADTFGYRLRKFIGRNRIAAAASIVIGATLVGGIAATSWQAYRAEQQRILADKRFREVRAIANNVVFKYHDEIEKLPGSTAVREMLVTDATAYLDSLATDSMNDPELERELGLAYLKLGDVQGKIYSANTGNTAGALDSYRKSIELLERVAAARVDDVAVKDDLLKAYDARLSISVRVNESTAYKQSLLERSAQLVEEILRVEPRSSKRLAQLSTLFVRKGDSVGTIGDRESLNAKLESHLRAEALANDAMTVDPDNPEILRIVARALQRVGTTYFWLGENALAKGPADAAADNFRAALPYHERMFKLVERLSGSVPETSETRRNRIAAHSSYSRTLSRNGRTSDALALARDAEAIAAKSQAADPANREAAFDIAELNGLFASIHEDAAQFQNAVAYYARSRDQFFGIFEDDRKNVEAINAAIDKARKLTGLLQKSGRTSEAEKSRRRTDELIEMRNSAIDRQSPAF